MFCNSVWKWSLSQDTFQLKQSWNLSDVQYQNLQDSHSWYLTNYFACFITSSQNISFQQSWTLLSMKLLLKLVNWYVSVSIFNSKLDSKFLDSKLTESLMIRWTIDGNDGITWYDNSFYFLLTCFGNMRNDSRISFFSGKVSFKILYNYSCNDAFTRIDTIRITHISTKNYIYFLQKRLVLEKFSRRNLELLLVTCLRPKWFQIYSDSRCVCLFSFLKITIIDNMHLVYVTLR